MSVSGVSLRRAADVAGAAVCATGAALALLDVHSPARPFVVLVAMVLGTGWAATTWIATPDAAYAGTLALAAGVAVPILSAMLFVEARWWHPVTQAGVLLAVAAAVNLAAAVRHRRPRAPSVPAPEPAGADQAGDDRVGDGRVGDDRVGDGDGAVT